MDTLLWSQRQEVIYLKINLLDVNKRNIYVLQIFNEHHFKKKIFNMFIIFADKREVLVSKFLRINKSNVSGQY